MNQAAAQNYMHSFHPNVDMSSAATPADLQRILAEQNEQAQRHLRLAQQFGGEPQNWVSLFNSLLHIIHKIINPTFVVVSTNV
jgi:hypothetical protein